MAARTVARSAFPTVLVLFGACTEEALPVEAQAGRFREAKAQCGREETSSYRVSEAFAADLSLELFDCGYALPSRVTISDDGRYLFVAQLQGRVYVYKKDANGFQRQPAPFYDLGDLGVHDEAGLTGFALAPGFDPTSASVERRDVFLAYQRRVEGQPRNRVRRLSATLSGNELVAEDAGDIFQPDEPSGQAHQIQQPVAFEHEGETHLLIPVGNAKQSESSRDPRTTNGTLVMMKRDGTPPDGPRPWPENAYVQALGLRNVYGVELVPEDIDPRRGLLGMENGDFSSDRGWYAHVLPTDSDNLIQRDLGAEQGDLSRGWRYVEDPTALGDEDEPRNSVFSLFTPTISPTAVSLHPGNKSQTIPPPGDDSVSFVGAFFGKSDTKDLTPGKNVQLIVLHNLKSGTLRVELSTMIERKPETFGLFRHPVGLDVDPENGDIYFSDIISGEINRVVVGG